MTTFVKIQSALVKTSIPDDDDWQEIADDLVNTQRSINWWLGDLIAYGEAQIGDEIYQYFPTDVSESMLTRCANVSRAYPIGQRHETLSWTHHYEAMRLNPEWRKAALVRAELEQMDTGAFKAYVSKLKGMG